jgi:hypothetical protein
MSMSGSRKRDPRWRLSRRGLLVVAGTGVAGHLVGCGDEGHGGSGGSATGGGAGAGGAGGSGGSGAGAGGGAGSAGGAGAGGGGGAAPAGSGGSGGGSGGPGGGGRGGSAGTGGSGGSGGSASDAGGADLAPDARIEVGNPPGMPDGGIAACEITRRDQLGPYHLDGHPERTTMATTRDGQILVVTGRVLDSRCRPIARAELDVWNANAKGVYSEDPQGWCRGKVHADADGSYRFETVYPGVYQGRPRHLHLIVGQMGFTRVTTQMYFKGERPDIPANAVDKVMMDGAWHCQWNIVLSGGLAARLQAPRPRPATGGRMAAPGSFPRRFWGAYWRPGKLA